jgi:ApeA N-terminal domain 1
VPDTHMAQGAERFTGTWWLPSEPNRRPGGVLIVHADGQVRLELDGALSTPPRRSHADEQVEYELIVGRVGVRPFTLHKCIQTEYLLEGNRHARQTLLVETVFDGLRAANADDLTFDAGSIEIDVLHEWAKWSGASGRIVSKTYRNDPPGRTRLVYDSPLAPTTVDNSLKLVLVPGIAVPQRVGHVEMNTWHRFDVELSEPLPFEKWYTLVLRPLQNFVSFVSDQAAWLNEVTVSRSARGVAPRRRRYPASVTVYGHWRRKDKEPAANLTPSDFLLSFDEAARAFDKVVPNWMRLSRDFRDALNLFFGHVMPMACISRCRFCWSLRR